MSLYPVILCGGAGSRLWPASRPDRPKPFISLLGETSLFQATALRLAPLADSDGEILVVTGAEQAQVAREQLDAIGLHATLLLEPEGRDSAPAMAAACAWIFDRDPLGTAVLTAADHHIPDPAAFREAVKQAAANASWDRIVALGVTPAGPVTSYGYIEPGPQQGPGPMSGVTSFIEKPDAVTATRFVASGFLWNSGNLVVRASILLSEFDRHAPEVSRAARAAVAEAQQRQTLGPTFLTAPRISVDHAVMEKTDRAAVLPVHFAWSDLGAWDAVWSAAPKDDSGNVLSGECVIVDSVDCLVRAGDGIQLAVVGTRGLAIVADQDQVLVCDLSSSQDVRVAVDRLKARGWGTRSPSRSFTSEAAVTEWFSRWLRTNALPLWWSAGADHDSGGFHEALTHEGTPVGAPRRIRVQARQIFVYAMAAKFGFHGPWLAAARHGAAYLRKRYRRPDGLYRTLVGADGSPLDSSVRLYDQAFVLLSMAALQDVSPDAEGIEEEALALLGMLQTWRLAEGGFREAGAEARQSDSLMHLLEASLAWVDVGGSAVWRELASELVDLALSRLIDPEDGVVRETFSPGWIPLEAGESQPWEPGHQFEWAWLLERWSRHGHPKASEAAHRLFETGLRGLDPRRGVITSAMVDGISPGECDARLWPQAEYLKAAVILKGDQRETHLLHAAHALAGYLQTPASGLWWDRRRPGGAFVQESSPASSLYHLTSAIMGLQTL